MCSWADVLCVMTVTGGSPWLFSVFGDANLRGNPSSAYLPHIHLHCGNFCQNNRQRLLTPATCRGFQGWCHTVTLELTGRLLPRTHAVATVVAAKNYARLTVRGMIHSEWDVLFGENKLSLSLKCNHTKNLLLGFCLQSYHHLHIKSLGTFIIF